MARIKNKQIESILADQIQETASKSFASQTEKEIWNSGGRIVAYESRSVVTTGDTTMVYIDIVEYDPMTDMLMVFMNKDHLQIGTDYVIDSQYCAIKKPVVGTKWLAGTYDFVVLKHILNGLEYSQYLDGRLLMDGSVAFDKLHLLFQKRIYALEKASYIANTVFINQSPTDSYSILIAGITDLSEILGIPIKFKAVVPNTGACSLKINNFASVPIYKNTSQDLETGDITSEELVSVVYDGYAVQTIETNGVVTLYGTQILSNKYFISPRFFDGDHISDQFGNELILFDVADSAVNEVSIANAATGSAPKISATGDDTNIDLDISAKGTGKVRINGVNLNGSMSAIEGRMTLAEKQGLTILNDVNELIQSADSLAAELSAMEAQIDGHTGDIADLNDRIDDLSQADSVGSAVLEINMDGVIDNAVMSSLRTIGYETEEMADYIEIVDGGFMVMSRERLYWTNGLCDTKTTVATAYPTRDVQMALPDGRPMYIRTSNTPTDDMTNTVTPWPVKTFVKSSGLPSYYTTENTVVGSSTTVPTKVSIPTPDAFDDESFYLPKTVGYLFNNSTAYWKEKPTLTLAKNDFPFMVHQYNRYMKMRISLNGQGKDAIPSILMGAGDGVTDVSGKSEITKNDDGLYLTYYKKTTGEPVSVVLGEEGFVSGEETVVITNTTIVNNLYAQYGRISNLTVNELNTSYKMITNYLLKDTDFEASIADVAHREIYDDRNEIWVCTTDGTEDEQVLGADDEPLYWTDATKTQIHTDVTDYPVMQWVYDYVLKYEQGTELVDGVYLPYTIEGVGDGVTAMSGRLKTQKLSDGWHVTYYQRTTGVEIGFTVTDDGVKVLAPELNALTLKNCIISNQDPTVELLPVGDIWFKYT